AGAGRLLSPPGAPVPTSSAGRCVGGCGAGVCWAGGCWTESVFLAPVHFLGLHPGVFPAELRVFVGDGVEAVRAGRHDRLGAGFVEGGGVLLGEHGVHELVAHPPPRHTLTSEKPPIVPIAGCQRRRTGSWLSP